MVYGKGCNMRNSFSLMPMCSIYSKFLSFFLVQSKKESRKLAYDVLLATSTNLRSSESNSADSDLQRLFTMVSYIKYSFLTHFPLFYLVLKFINCVLSDC
jgi:hypothetical protein